VDFLNGNRTSFLIHPDQVETFPAIGRHGNPGHFSSLSCEPLREVCPVAVPVPIAVDPADDDSYFKFNLDINLYNLIRLEASSVKSICQSAYSRLRSHTSAYQNALRASIGLSTTPQRGSDKG
jgi:hypothetical protein